MAGYVFYIDRFAGTLAGVREKLPYLKDLGITYVHFMPCLKPRPGDSDGGYSVMDYRKINPAFGTMKEFEAVCGELREAGISVCVDMVLNHTAKEHEWAVKARAGDPKYRDYYLFFPDDRLPKQYEETLVEVFPENAPGSFTFYPDIGQWVWTTFNEHQWDLNWANPWVFLEMAEVMLYLRTGGWTSCGSTRWPSCGSGWGRGASRSRRCTCSFRRCGRRTGSWRRRSSIWKRRS